MASRMIVCRGRADQVALTARSQFLIKMTTKHARGYDSTVFSNAAPMSVLNHGHTRQKGVSSGTTGVLGRI